MQILGPVLALLAFAGGLFVPLEQSRRVLQTLGHVHPAVRPHRAGPRAADRGRRRRRAVVNVLVWLAVFVGGAVWRFRRDTARV